MSVDDAVGIVMTRKLQENSGYCRKKTACVQVAVEESVSVDVAVVAASPWTGKLQWKLYQFES